MTSKLTDQQVSKGLESIPEWGEINGQITRTFQFETFVRSIEFVNQIAQYAEANQHHPDVMVRYNKVTLTVSTHDANGITEKDFALASAADEMGG